MKISDHRITIKTLRPSEHGWSKYSHQTHIGCCENYIDNWERLIIYKDSPLGVPNEIPLAVMSTKLKEKITLKNSIKILFSK